MEWSHRSNSGTYWKGGSTERRGDKKMGVEEMRSEKGKEEKEEKGKIENSRIPENDKLLL